MSLFDYQRSLELSSEPFYALIMAAMRQADDENLLKLKFVFPRTWSELQLRYNLPGGLLESEKPITPPPQKESL